MDGSSDSKNILWTDDSVHLVSTVECTSFCSHPGQDPEDGDGDVKIVLTDASASALAHVHGMKKWRVGPTMTRGSKAVTSVKGVLSQKMPAPKMKKVKVTKMLKPRKKKEKTEKPVVATVDPGAWSEISFRRTPQGREAIKSVMLELWEQDKAAHPHSPVFDDSGRCRMKFQGASNFKWEEILEASGKCMEQLYLAFHLLPLKYRGPEAFCRVYAKR